MPASRATPRPPTCTATSRATAWRPRELLRRQDARSRLRRRDRRRGPSPTWCLTAGRGFWVLLADGQRISARRLLVTTGLRDELPDIPGLRDRWARDVLHCPYCHGHEVRDRQLGVIGGTPGAVRYAQIVRQWTHDLVYFTPPDTLTAAERTELLARAIGVVEGTIDQLVIDDDDQLRGVQMRRRLRHPPRRAVRPTPLRAQQRPAPRARLPRRCRRLGHRRPAGRTSVPGVWAAGNVVDPRAQVITAAGAGSAAAIALNADLVDDDVRIAVHDLSHGLTPAMTNHLHSTDKRTDPQESA